MRTWASLIAALAILGLSAGQALAQGQVDLQLNLSTQPVYGGYRSTTSSYFDAGGLYSTGNVRGGRALMINRNFLEDRFFSGTLTRFYRDTVGATDITSPGYTVGGTQPYFRPGSLTVSGASVRSVPTTGGMSPFGLNFNPAAALPSPFSVITYQRPDDTPSRAQYPTSTAMRTFELESETPTEPQTTSPVLGWDRKAEEPGQQQLPQLPTAESMFAPKKTEDGTTTEGTATTPGAPQEILPATPEPPEQGLRPMDYLRDRFGAESTQTKEPAPAGTEGTVPGEAAAPSSATMPEAAVIPGARPRRFYEQYMAMGREELQAGAYRPAADAFHKAADFNLLNAWDAKLHEAVAHLMTREYLVAAYQLSTVIADRPAAAAKGGALTLLVNRPDDWKAVEADLRQTLVESPKSAESALCLAWLLTRSGRAGETEELLAVAAKNELYDAAVKALREMLKQ